MTAIRKNKDGVLACVGKITWISTISGYLIFLPSECQFTKLVRESANLINHQSLVMITMGRFAKTIE